MESPTPVGKDTLSPTQDPTPIDTPIEPLHLYDLNYGYEKIELEANENLFGIKIEGSIVDGDKVGWETIYDDNVNKIFNRETYTSRNFDLYRELQPGQARALEEQYGQFVKLTREDADFNPKGDGQLDTVKIKYEGTHGSFTYESDIPEKGTTRLIWDFMKGENLV